MKIRVRKIDDVLLIQYKVLWLWRQAGPGHPTEGSLYKNLRILMASKPNSYYLEASSARFMIRHFEQIAKEQLDNNSVQ